eukprot:789704-Prorocentrum_lima.AAC.1
MTSSLVGSEMCIRDRARCMRSSMLAMSSSRARLRPTEFSGLARRRLTVSYTHLTLPTICSV